MQHISLIIRITVDAGMYANDLAYYTGSTQASYERNSEMNALQLVWRMELQNQVEATSFGDCLNTCHGGLTVITVGSYEYQFRSSYSSHAFHYAFSEAGSYVATGHHAPRLAAAKQRSDGGGDPVQLEVLEGNPRC